MFSTQPMNSGFAVQRVSQFLITLLAIAIMVGIAVYALTCPNCYKPVGRGTHHMICTGEHNRGGATGYYICDLSKRWQHALCND